MTDIKRQIELAVEKVMKELSNSTEILAQPADSTGGDGVFQEMEEAIQAALIAQKTLLRLSLAKRSEIIQAIRDTGRENRQEYGRMELDETDLGSAEGTVLKLEVACSVPGIEDIKPDIYTGDMGVTIVERIPMGVIASINAVTNAAPGIVHNAIMMLAGGNTVVNNPHPKTNIISARVVQDLNRAIVAKGGPLNCVTTISKSGIPTARYLMTHEDIDMITVTGGHKVVEFAWKTGKRILAGGPGNPPVMVDDTADLDRAAQCIVRGASFSNCTPCSSEKEIFVVETVADRLKKLLIQYGAFGLREEPAAELMKVIFKEIKPGKVPSVINPDFIGKPPHVILKRAIGLDIPEKTKIVVLEADKSHPLIWTEQIMPIIPLVRCRDTKDVIHSGIAAEQGMRHTMVFHSNDLGNMSYLSSIADASQLIINASSIGGIGVDGEGFKSLLISTGGEGLARPGNFTLTRRCVMTDNFRYRYGTRVEV